jgi:pimeloyl-ACP methyl ester carboxylesterase
MATTAAAPQRRHRFWRVLRWLLLIGVPLLAALLAFALLRPLALLIMTTQVRLWFDGIHSEYMEIPYAGSSHVRVHYFAGGSGDPVVLVHGLGGRAEDWANLMPLLVKGHHRVYALDLPGYGRSDWPRDASYSIAEESQAVEAFMDQLHLAHTDLAGWSMGGWIAMQVALDQPQRIRRLVIFDSAGITFNLNWNTALFEPDTPQKLRDLDNLLWPTPAPAVPGFIQRAIFRYVDQHGWVVRRNMDSMLTGKDLLDNKLGGLRMPMLIIWGQQDHLLPVSIGEQIHRDVPQSELEIFVGCGHLGPEQCAGRMAPVVNGFLSGPIPIPGREAVVPK